MRHTVTWPETHVYELKAILGLSTLEKRYFQAFSHSPPRGINASVLSLI